MSFLVNPYVYATAGGGSTPEVEFDGRSLLGADNTDITQWDDTSGHARHATSPPGQRPKVRTGILNGNPIGRWAAAAELLDWSGNANPTAFTVIAVMKCTNSGSPRTLLSANTGGAEGSIPLVWISSNKIELVNTDVAVLATSTTTLSTSSFYTVAVTYVEATGAYAFYLNGSADGSGTATAVGFAHFFRLGCRNGNQNSFLGDIAYAAVWDSVLSGGELTTRFDDLRTVWAHY